MKQLTPLLASPLTAGEYQIANAAEGFDAFVLTELAKGIRQPLLLVLRDDVQMAAMAAYLRFFAPDLPRLRLPAWDCLPYDRVSPARDIVAERLASLAFLAQQSDPSGSFILLSTVAALCQRTLPPDILRRHVRRLEKGREYDTEELLHSLTLAGYQRASTVVEPGDFAMRGGLLDIFAAGHRQPLRLDFFGDSLETIRSFDPASQRSTSQRAHLDLLPISEVLIDDAAIARFRRRYRVEFGAVTSDDPLYEAVSSGSRPAGVEHWLPLFYEQTATLFDYLPEPLIIFSHQAAEAQQARWDQIEEHYQARAAILNSGSKELVPYNPMPPSAGHIMADDWQALVQARAQIILSPFALAEGKHIIDVDARQGPDFAALHAAQGGSAFDAVHAHIQGRRQPGHRFLITGVTTGSADRLAHLLQEHGQTALTPVDNFAELQRLSDSGVGITTLPLEHGFASAGLTVISEQDILGERMARRGRRQRRDEDVLKEAAEISPGAAIVHIDHGIGRYMGLITIDVGGAPHDCLHLNYAGGDKLYLPVENIEMLSRYGGDGSTVILDKLGGAGWQARKAKLKKRLHDMAEELIAVAAARAMKKAAKITRPEGLYDEIAARFPFEETDDQQRAIEAVFEDLALGRPMDRLICGDVGFGKTEVALRSAFAAALCGFQVAVVAPTTLLSRQHFETFRQRFHDLPVKIAQLSRLVSNKDAQAARKGLTDGTIDIVIGTHALLSKSVQFQRLGLLIIDEEQHFGVAHKERLKRLRADIHVLTLTATPIPRTLQLAMTGVKSLSLIATPPVDRLAVRTFVMPTDPVILREALMRERYRGGQSFYVCPRIKDLPEAEEFLREHVPELRLVTAHGQMAAGQLEEVMNAFYDGAYDILLSTTIIESGLDIPRANTMIVHRADRFGLAQLYQLRGRIGRAKQRAYAYFTLPPKKKLTADAEKRLKVLQSLDSLGAGFTLASYDLDIRGAGNLLGDEQSGHIREVGFELYQQMLEEAIAAAQRGEGDSAELLDGDWSPQINLGTPVLIPESYIADLDLRLGLYRRIGALQEVEELDAMAAELVDRFGRLPDEVTHLLDVIAIKQLCRKSNVAKVDAGAKGATLSFRSNQFADPAALVAFIQQQQDTAKLRPDHTLVYLRSWDNAAARLRGVQQLLQQLVALLPDDNAAAHSAAE